MGRHQLHQVGTSSETLGNAGDNRGASTAAAAASSSSSRRANCNSNTNNSSSSTTAAERYSLSLPHQPLVPSLSAPSGGPSLVGALPAAGSECRRRGTPLAASFSCLGRAGEQGVLRSRSRVSPAEEDPVPWKSVDLFAWSLLDENGNTRLVCLFLSLSFLPLSPSVSVSL